MMMPANYSVVAENEMTYVVGGGIADVLAPMMTAKNVQNIVVNTISMVGSYFVNNVIVRGLGAVFSRGFGADYSDVTAAALGFLPVEFSKDNWFNALGNLALNTVGMASAIYTMGMDVIGPKFDGIIKRV